MHLISNLNFDLLGELELDRACGEQFRGLSVFITIACFLIFRWFCWFC